MSNNQVLCNAVDEFVVLISTCQHLLNRHDMWQMMSNLLGYKCIIFGVILLVMSLYTNIVYKLITCKKNLWRMQKGCCFFSNSQYRSLLRQIDSIKSLLIMGNLLLRGTLSLMIIRITE